jgi:hypothetical protein
MNTILKGHSYSGVFVVVFWGCDLDCAAMPAWRCAREWIDKISSFDTPFSAFNIVRSFLSWDWDLITASGEF